MTRPSLARIEPHNAASPTPQTPTDRRSTTVNTKKPTYEWGMLYPSGRIVSTADVDPTPQVTEANLMGLDLVAVRRQIGPWQKVAS